MPKLSTLVPFMALLVAHTALADTEFAAPSCETGCTLVDHLSNTPHVVYAGAEDRTYRICAGDSWIVHIGLDGKSFDLNPELADHKLCVNVKGKSITVSGTAGSAWIGPVAP